MKLFLKENRSLIVIQGLLITIVLGIFWLAGFRNCIILAYVLFLYFVLFTCFLIYKYTTRREFYRLLSESHTEIEDSLRKLDYAPISTSLSLLLKRQYELFQEQIVDLQKKQDEHLIFIDRWIHQMKTPISVLELMAKELDEPDSSNVREEIDRLKSGLSTIMYMSKLRTIQEDFRIEQVHLPSLFEEIQRENRRLFIRNKVYPKLKQAEDITVESDEKWLFFMINQLISNAIKYTDGQANEIHFLFYKTHDRKVFEIRDFGVGIPKQDMKRIFNAFYTGENGRRFRESTGVGLYIVKEVATYLGHEIKVESEVNKGTTFQISF